MCGVALPGLYGALSADVMTGAPGRARALQARVAGWGMLGECGFPLHRAACEPILGR